MNIQEENIKKIQVAFKKMQTKEDLLKLINFVGVLEFGVTFKAIELKKLTYYANASICKKRYKIFIIKKKSGSDREISAPVGALKIIQKCLKVIFECIYEPHPNATGFVSNKSIVDNANFHLSKTYVYNIDLKDFFPSIHLHRVKACLHNAPFSLSSKKDSAQEELAFLISKLCTHPRIDEDGKIIDSLPQGAPTSPILSNVVVQRLDRRLNGLAKTAGVSYSRYADDITFSSNHTVYSKESDFQQELKRHISEQNLTINEKKTRLQKSLYTQEVTGLVVNKKANTRKSYVKNIRTILNNWEKTGYTFAEQEFLKHYINKQSSKPNMASVIGGKLEYLKMVKGEEDPTYQKLKTRFDLLNVFQNEGITTKEVKTNSTFENKKAVDSKFALSTPIKIKSIRKSNKIIGDNEQTTVLPKKHNPHRLITLLNQFSLNNSPLKYSTHSWDHGQVEGVFMSHGDFIKKAVTQYKSFSYELRELNKNLAGKIYGFIEDEKLGQIDPARGYKRAWGMNRIKIGWSSPELKSWCERNTTQNPMEMVLPEEYQLFANGNQITTFRQVVNLFKQEIEIREEDNQLKKLFSELEDKHIMSFDFEILQEGLEHKSFFTDVQWLYGALDKIFESFSKRTHFKNISIIATDNLDSLQITIEQIGSFNENKSIHDPKLSGQNGDFGDILKYLTNLCDWSVESRFKEGMRRINYLTTKNNCEHIEEIDSCTGFKHIFRFYKTNA